jgi:hypothetical protein
MLRQIMVGLRRHQQPARVCTNVQDLTSQLELLIASGCDEIFHGKQSRASDRLCRSLKMILAAIDDIYAGHRETT